MTTMPPRFPITAEQIELVVTRFYAAARKNPTLGPIFAAHVTDWSTHEAKIAGFWRNAILMERSYDGNPMRAHMNAGNVRADHFDVWLELFDEVLQTTLPAATSKSWSALAHRIGRGLRIGVRDVTRPAGGIPNLR